MKTFLAIGIVLAALAPGSGLAGSAVATKQGGLGLNNTLPSLATTGGAAPTFAFPTSGTPTYTFPAPPNAPSAGDVLAGIGTKQTWLAEQMFEASSSSNAGINIGVGSAPSSPANGDFWATVAGVYSRVNGVTVGPFGAGELTNVYDATSCMVSSSTGSADEASCIQGFINAANTAGGGIVWIGSGFGNLKSQVTVKAGVTLQCANNGAGYDSNTMAYGGKGSVFAILWGSGSVAYTNAAILMDYNSGVRNCGFWYPSQSAAASSPTVYGPTIALYTSNGSIGNVNQTIADNFFANSYEAMGIAGSYANSGVGRLHVQRNNGSCIYACYYINFVVDWSTIDHNHWNSGGLWNGDPTPSSHLRGWVALNGFVAYVQHSDWLLFDYEQAWGYGQGIGEDFATACCGSFTDNGPVVLSNSQFDAVYVAMIVNYGVAQDNRMINNTLTGFSAVSGVGGYAYYTSSGATTSTVTMIGNHQFGPAGGFYGNAGTVTRSVIQGNTSAVTGGSANGVALGSGTSAIVIGNDMNGYTNAVNVGTVTNVVNQYNTTF